ncbi:MAG: cob(I)yrinic acid a,c-diamide adenosyltransferase [Candidatus Marinimicrobia bacterium]|nr:cob(I)yrinic acid a,c-diamide adenosyltransferase [Candidatus Neomarinimicrobiota bacterium]
MKGRIHLYTGNGKGKTTAALGLSLRAAGAGKNVFFAQFIKGKKYSEITAIEKFFSAITVKQYGLDCFIINEPTPADIDAARKGLKEVAHIIASGKYGIVVLDEICIAVFYKLISLQKLIDVLNTRAQSVEIVLTGRYAPSELIELSDLVTEMQEVKHYYHKGEKAREGIEF